MADLRLGLFPSLQPLNDIIGIETELASYEETGEAPRTPPPVEECSVDVEGIGEFSRGKECVAEFKKCHINAPFGWRSMALMGVGPLTGLTYP